MTLEPLWKSAPNNNAPVDEPDAPCRHCGKMREDHEFVPTAESVALNAPPEHTAFCIGVVDKWGDRYEYEPVDPDEADDAMREYERERGE